VDDPVAVGRRLREARLAAGLSQRQLAFPGCTAAYLSRIEVGARVPSLQLLRELGHRLGVSEAYLATGSEDTVAADEAKLVSAEVALRLDELDEAERLYDEALEQAAEPQERAAALAGLGQLAFRRGDPRLTVERFEDAISLAAETERRPDVAETLGRAYMMLGEVERTIATFERALAAAEERGGHELEVVRFSVLLANALIDSGGLDRAQELLGRTLARTHELADPLIRARIYWSQSRLHALRSEHETAARYARSALQILEVSEDTRALARAHQLLAHIELDRGNAEEALALVRRGREVLGEGGNRFDRGKFRLEEARALAHLGSVDEAMEIAMEAVGLLAETNPAEAGRGFVLLAEAFEGQGEIERARELYELAVELLERLPTRYLIQAYARLGDLLEREGRTQDALELMKKAVRVQAEIGVPR
jgi:tetratricopeptide (TPR) repeat protein